MKGHVREKMDEKRSNCGAAVKKSIISKFTFVCQFSSQTNTHSLFLIMLSDLLEIKNLPTLEEITKKRENTDCFFVL